MLRLALFLAALTLVACGTSSPPSAAAAPDAGVIAQRPYTLVVPNSYDASKPTPFVFMMHGYGASGQLEELYMGLTPAAQAHGFLYAFADGTLDKSGARFWNATDACCDLDGAKVD